MRDPFSRLADRKTKRVKGKDLIEMHRMMVEEFNFDVKIDEEGMSKLLHPYHGYFTAIKDGQIS